MPNVKDSNNLELDFERICILYANTNFGYTGMILAVVFLYFVVHQYSSPGLANLWAFIMFIVYVPRILTSVLFVRKLKNKKITQENIKPWEHYMTLSSIAPYICFIAVIFFPYGEHVYVSTLICAVAFLALAIGGVIALTTSLTSIMLYLNLAIFSIILKCISFQETIYIVLACFLFVGNLMVMKLIIMQHKTLIENIALKIENNRFSLTDPLTKLWNRRRLDLHVEKLVPAAKRSGNPFSLIFLDIDHFKQYNDTKGHSEGDVLLKKVADVLNECSREEDLVVRYGGEEFIVILPQTRIKDAEVIAERIRTTVKAKTDVTISAGLAEYNENINFDQLLQKADEALYTAKNTGRDQYVLAPA